jgi:metal-responsive CopG/Arc/MetJ family transcriptional regulator
MITIAKVLLSIDDSLLDRIDRAAKARGLSRSAYLSRLAAQDLELAAGPGRRTSVREALRGLEALFAAAPPGDAAAELRAERQAR